MYNALTTERINAGENEFILYRFDTNNENVLIPVATLSLRVTGNNRVAYTIEYDNQEPLGNGASVTTTGHLDVNNGIVDMSGILFVDQFTAGTALNEHPSRYYYVLKLDNADKTTYYINPKNGDTKYFTSNKRAKKWVFSGIHYLNIKWLVEHPVCWTIVIWLLCLGGAFVSLTGALLGLKYIKRLFK
jgi:hypothetical protein